MTLRPPPRWSAPSLTGIGVSAALLAGCAPPPARAPGERGGQGAASFEVNGEPLCFVGANNYYLAYKPPRMVDEVLEGAHAMGVKVVRLWAFIDRGSSDGSVPSIDGDGAKEGHYFQSWDPITRRPVYNDGPTGLGGLDYALAKAGQLGLKVVLVLTNNWHEFGGMDQYLAWYGLRSHQDFYTSGEVAAAYRSWVYHLATRVNPLIDRAYRDDPTIFSWELANEPRGIAGTPAAIVSDWAGAMSSYIKSIDSHHLVAVGDEGFLAGRSTHWTYNADNGVDHRALTALPNIDYATFHLYPETWGTGFGWDERWIDDHLSVARALGKPAVLEEYGLKVERDASGRISAGLETRLATYRAWNERTLAGGGSAAMFWLLVGHEPNGAVYPDYDHFSVYPGDASSQLLAGFARRFTLGAPACQGAASDAGRAPSPFVRVRAAQGRPRASVASAE